MGDDEDTSIRVKKDTWKRLRALQKEPGVSFDETIRELLNYYEEENRSPAKAEVLAD